MTEEMKEQMYDEELIEAFKFYGAKNDRDGFTKDDLRAALEGVGEKIDEDDLELLFEETSITGGGKIMF